MEQGSWTEAVKWLRGALEIEPQHRVALEGLAKYYEHAGELQEAKRYRRLAEQAARNEPAVDGKNG
jgi:Tfp pilus assembly protein PilF